MSGPTQGPWEVRPSYIGGDDTFEVFPTYGGEDPESGVWTKIATVRAGCRDDDAAEEALANARLMAASPELLAALKDMLSGWRYIREVHGDLSGVGWDRAEDAARAALKKAEG